MSEEKVTRLYKVAKELNVGTSKLVETLHTKGFKDVEDNPNTKLTSDQVNVLLREFLSDKQLKDKADKFSEKRKEDMRGSGIIRTEAEEPVQDTEDSAKASSASDLRSGLNMRRRPPVNAEPKIETPATPPPAPKAVETVAKTETSQPVVETPVSAPTPPKEEAPLEVKVEEKTEVRAPEKQDSGIGLKVLGKIELDGKNNRTGKPKDEQPKQEAVKPQPPTPKVEPPKPVAQPQAIKEAPKVPVVTPKVETAKPAELPKVEETPVKQPVPVAKAIPAPVEVPAEPKDETITVSDNTPQLKGLKVVGKIDLTPPSRKKAEPAKPATPASPAAGSDDADSEEKKKKRRRRRKRKTSEGATTAPIADDKKKTETVTSTGVGSTAKPPQGKDKFTKKDVDDKIRQTMTQIGKGTSRSRQISRRGKRDAFAQRREEQEQRDMEESKILQLTEFITANEFANLIDVQVTDIITKSFQLGTMISINQRLEADLLSILAEEYGYTVNFVDVTEAEQIEEDVDETLVDDQPRNPIITVMGHVDHGKTTLLDYLRKTNVTAGEAGGITQHIGAYEVKLKSGRTATFLDTPGHEAFTAMRARGAKVTDVAIIVIAADDAVMPQTKEAISHSQAAGVQMVFAISKVDKPSANTDRIRTQLSEMNLLVEDWGGKYQCQEISALKGIGVDDLLEKVIVESDLQELMSNPAKSAIGTVIETRVDRGRGNVATMLVQNGTLKIGDEMVAGIHYGKVRALINQNGERIESAGPATPVQILGLDGLPTAGDRFQVFREDGKAKSIAQRRTELFREQQLRQSKHLTLEEIGRRKAIGNFQELNLIIRADVDGSAEALAGALLKLSTPEVSVNILFKGVGAINEADVNLATASDAVVIAFNVRPNAQARALAEREEIDIRTYSVIYNAIDDVHDALEGMLSPEIKEEITGTLEVREVFKVHRVGTIAGCLVTSGKINRNDKARVIRDGVVIYESALSSLKRYKDDVKDVIAGQECGLTVDRYNDVREGDVIETFRQKEVRRKL